MTDEDSCSRCTVTATYLVGWPKGEARACDGHLIEVVDVILVQGYRATVEGA